MNLPIVAVTFVAIWLFAPESRDETKTPLDPVGALLSLVGLSALVFAIIQGGEDGWTTDDRCLQRVRRRRRRPRALRSSGNGAASIRCCRSTLFRDRRFSVGSVVITIAFFVMFGFFFLATQYLQFGRGYSPLEAGLATLPLPIMFVAFSPRSAVLAERFGAAP